MKMHVSSETLASGFFPPSFSKSVSPLFQNYPGEARTRTFMLCFLKVNICFCLGVYLPCHFIFGGGGRCQLNEKYRQSIFN